MSVFSSKTTVNGLFFINNNKNPLSPKVSSPQFPLDDINKCIGSTLDGLAQDRQVVMDLVPVVGPS